ncbi:MAG: coproporphyrinogen III oxidase [Aeriscardovia sp.]|nr:coproporphyrinogen III oxidase [Aeriscardovia sp.]
MTVDHSFRPTGSTFPQEDPLTLQHAYGNYVAHRINPSTPLELYIHVPFCVRRCGYCDFNTYTATDLGHGASRSQFAHMIEQEIHLLDDWQEQHGIPRRPLSTIFFGGGTPTLLPAEDLVHILTCIRRTWGILPHAEITTEANPDTVNEQSIETLANGGFTRISFGMQSAVPRILTILDRTHDQQNVIRGVRAAQENGLRTSIDLIYGTPTETMEEWKQSLTAAVDLHTTHISCYALTVAPHTKMGRIIRDHRIPPVNDDDEAEKYEFADQFLTDHQFTWYEISNWSIHGEESQHNLGYWKNVDWFGLGPGAHAHLTTTHIHDELHPRIWADKLNAHLLPWVEPEYLTAEENLEETILLGIRLREGLPLSRIIPSLTNTQTNHLTHEIHQLEHDQLLTLTHQHLIPTLKGRLLNDLIITRLLESITPQNNHTT